MSSGNSTKQMFQVVGVVGAIAAGYFLGCGGQADKKPDNKDSKAATATAKQEGPERIKVALDPKGTWKGGSESDALVTIVEFSDFECPFCSRAVPTLEQVHKEYGDKVRVQFRQNPLPFHQNAGPAAEAAVFAHTKGKFWEMHDKLFANQKALTRADLEKYAQELGLPADDFKKALDSGAAKQQIAADMEVARKVGAQGTPNFFVNGRPIRGAMPFDAFKKIIDEELATAKQLGGDGKDVYAKLMAKASDGPPAPKAPPAPGADAQVFKIPADGEHAKGPKDAKITIIEFSEFECPFCGRVTPTIQQLFKDYEGKIRLVFKHNPLPFHPHATPASEAAFAAGAQGKFWEMHDKLFANQKALERANLETYAQEIGLDLAKFKADLDSGKFKEQIKKDQDLGAKFGARGTPTFFINGRTLRGAQPIEGFKKTIDEELAKVEKLGVPADQVYAELTKAGLTEAPKPPPPAAKPGTPDPKTIYKVDLGKSPMKGSKDAPVTIVIWSDYQCPFCSRVEGTLKQIEKEYGDKVRFVWKDLPLPFHPNAKPSATLARVAAESGKFWEMHDKLFDNQKALARPDLEKYAQEMQLPEAKVKAALDSDKFAKDIEADVKQGNKLGANGTPAFYINGRNLSGAQPFEAFKAVIDEELKRAEPLQKKGLKGDKLYAELVKGGKTEVPSGPAGGDEEDKKVYKVDAGNGPSKGPKAAPVQIVIFSDFECPFCSRVEPTLKQIEKAYEGKVRITWRNYPLPFHQNATPAAMASMAAHAQGKFWEMHDKMFENQKALSRPDLEKYATDLGLDMAKFKADLDGNKYKADIDKDIAYGNSISGPIGTPTLFINGRKVAGAMPFESFKQLIDDSLKGGKKPAANKKG